MTLRNVQEDSSKICKITNLCIRYSFLGFLQRFREILRAAVGGLCARGVLGLLGHS